MTRLSRRDRRALRSAKATARYPESTGVGAGVRVKHGGHDGLSPTRGGASTHSGGLPQPGPGRPHHDSDARPAPLPTWAELVALALGPSAVLIVCDLIGRVL